MRVRGILRSVAPPSFFPRRWELFLIDSHRRRDEAAARGQDGFTDGGGDVKAAAVRLGIRQAGAVRVRPSVRPVVFFTGFKDGRKRPGMGITTEKYPGSLPPSLLPSLPPQPTTRLRFESKSV